MCICISPHDFNFLVWNQCRDLANCISSQNLNLFLTRMAIDCHLSPVIHLRSSIDILSRSISGQDPSCEGIHLLSSISCRPTIFDRDAYLAPIHLRRGSISCYASLPTICRRPSPVAIHLVLIPLALASRFHPVHNSTRVGRITYLL